jgi:hypothetical protein
MKTKTLKALITSAIENSETKEELVAEVVRLIELFEEDAEGPIGQAPSMQKFADYQPVSAGKVPYSTICFCNPANGGSGICGCTMGNRLVDPMAPVQRGLFEIGMAQPVAKVPLVASWPNTDSTTVG